MPCWSSMAPDGTSARNSRCQKTSPCCPCHPMHRNSIRSRTSGSTCGPTIWRSASTAPTTPSSMLAARPGTASLLSQTASHPSLNANGPSCHDLWRLVLDPFERQSARVIESLLGHLGVGDGLLAERGDRLHHFAAQGVRRRKVSHDFAGEGAKRIQHFVRELLQDHAVLADQRPESAVVLGDEFVHHEEVSIAVRSE